VQEETVIEEFRPMYGMLGRAVEAAIRGMPAVNYDLMLQEMLTKTPGKVNRVIYWAALSAGGTRR
jgi:hypothetical protein